MRATIFFRNFVLLILGQVSSLTGNFTLKFALSMYVLDNTRSAQVFASLMAIGMLPTLFFSPLGGILADRINPRKLMVALDALSGLTVLAAVLRLAGGFDLGTVGLLLVFLSIFAAFESPVVQCCVPLMLPENQLLQGNALVGQVSAVTSLLSPFLGSILYAAAGILPVLWGAAACFLLTALLECFFRLSAPIGRERQRFVAGIFADLSKSLRFLRQDQPEIVKLLLLAALTSLFMAGTAVVGFPFLVRTVLGFSAQHYGAAESAMGMAAIAGGAWMSLRGQKLRPLKLYWVFVGLGLSLIPAGLAFILPLNALARYLILTATFCIVQVGCSIFSTYALTLIQQRTPRMLMGKIMALVYTISLCAQPLGQIAYGALFDRFSQLPQCILIPSGLIVCAIGLVCRRFFRRLTHRL